MLCLQKSCAACSADGTGNGEFVVGVFEERTTKTRVFCQEIYALFLPYFCLGARQGANLAVLPHYLRQMAP
jgi:hypothetical protein